MESKSAAKAITILMLGLNAIYCGLIYKLGTYEGEETAYQNWKAKIQEIFGVEN